MLFGLVVTVPLYDRPTSLTGPVLLLFGILNFTSVNTVRNFFTSVLLPNKTSLTRGGSLRRTQHLTTKHK